MIMLLNWYKVNAKSSGRLMTDIWAATLIMPCLLCTCALQAHYLLLPEKPNGVPS